MRRLFAALVLIAMLAPAAAAPVLSASMGGVSVLLFDDQCTLDQVGGRPYRRAQWIEGGGNHGGLLGCGASARWARGHVLVLGPHAGGAAGGVVPTRGQFVT